MGLRQPPFDDTLNHLHPQSPEELLMIRIHRSLTALCLIGFANPFQRIRGEKPPLRPAPAREA